MKRKRKSRLTRKEELRSLRQAIFYGGLTLILGLVLVFFGIPAMIRMAIFLGNLRSSSLPVETRDTFPPQPPTFKPLPEATNSAQINLYGFTEAGATVKIFQTGKETQKVVADQSGSFDLGKIRLETGKNEFYAVAVDEDGNTSSESERQIVFFDDLPPALELLQPENGQDFSGEQSQVEVVGRTEEADSVYVNEHLVIVDREGNFRYPVMLKEGENLIKVVAKDKAGNQNTEEIIVNYSL